MYLKATLSTLIVLLFVLHAGTAVSQSTERPTNDQGAQLKVVQSVLEAKLLTRAKLREKIISGLPADVADNENDLQNLNAEIIDLRNSFEQIAVGSIDLGLFDNEDTSFDIQTEMTQVIMPIVRNLQSLTEKPRKIEALRTRMSTTRVQIAAANRALNSIDQSISVTSDASTKKSLQALQTNWTGRVQELERRLRVAIVQLANLQKKRRQFLEEFQSRHCRVHYWSRPDDSTCRGSGLHGLVYIQVVV